MNKDWLFECYHVKQMSMRQIAKEAGCPYSRVLLAMRKFKIPRRDKSEALSGDKNPMYGKKHTAEVIQKISQSSKDKMTPEAKENLSKKLSGEGNPMYGKTHTEEARNRIKEAAKLRMSDPQFKQNISDKIKEKWHHPEYREIISNYAKTRTGDKNPFYGKQHSDETRKIISDKNKGKFVGEKGSNWQGGKTPLNHSIRTCSEYISWRDQIFKRDNYTCQFCRKIGGKLCADHIKPFATILKENNVNSLESALLCKELWNIGNGRVLCYECHMNTDTYGNHQNGKS
jgi:hypothetical protein